MTSSSVVAITTAIKMVLVLFISFSFFDTRLKIILHGPQSAPNLFLLDLIG
jgi:hypothetical protein